MKSFYSIMVLSILVISCSTKNNNKKEAENVLNKEKQSIFKDLVSKYNIHYMLDTIDNDYTIDYNPIIESKYQLIDEFSVNDIFQRDSILYISISTWGSIMDLILPITSDQINLFRKEGPNYILVVSLKEVKKIKFSFDGSVDSEGNSDISLENSGSFYAKGELIEIASKKE